MLDECMIISTSLFPMLHLLFDLDVANILIFSSFADNESFWATDVNVSVCKMVCFRSVFFSSFFFSTAIFFCVC